MKTGTILELFEVMERIYAAFHMLEYEFINKLLFQIVMPFCLRRRCTCARAVMGINGGDAGARPMTKQRPNQELADCPLGVFQRRTKTKNEI